MAVVRGDRIAESKKLNLCSFSAHVAYGTFVGCVPDDFGRFRATPTAIAERMFPRREADRGRIVAQIRTWLAEWAEDRGEGALVKLWTVDGVSWGEMTGWRATGNLNHRTPEPPWSEHAHTARCSTTALARAKEWGSRDQVEALSLLVKEMREQKSKERANREHVDGNCPPEGTRGPSEGIDGPPETTGASGSTAQRVTRAEPEHPSSSSSSSSSSSNGEGGEGEGRPRTDLPAPTPSNGRHHVSDETATAIEAAASDLAQRMPDVPAEEWVARASRIEASSSHRARSFRRPREPGVSEAWAQVTLRKLRAEIENHDQRAQRLYR